MVDPKYHRDLVKLDKHAERHEPGGSDEVSMVGADTGGGRLTVKEFHISPATSTCSFTPYTYATFSNIDEYCEIILPAKLHITQFRYWGNDRHTGDGSYKIQYMDVKGDWNDWVTGIVTRTTNDWSNWDSSGGDVEAIAIRLVATAIDTLAQNRPQDFQVKY